MIAMQVYIVTTDDRPCGVTLDEREACSMYNRILRSGRHRQAAVHVVAAEEDRRQVLLEFHRGF